VVDTTAVVEFGELSIVPDGEEFIVGDPALGVFLGLPEIGVTAIESLRAGRTVGETAAILGALAGEDVNLTEFVAGLMEAGLVRSVNGAAMTSTAAGPGQRRWIAGVRPEHARWLFGRTAWLCYAACAAWSLGVLALLPQYRPSFESTLFYPDPAISIGVIVLVAIVIGSVHEAWHWLAARAEGVGARFAVSRRAFLPVLETDLTQLWSLPRRRRYGPLLAGLAFDFVVLAACLLLRIAARPMGTPPVIDRFLAVVVLIEVVQTGFQCLVFLRTDLYLVVSTALGCQDLLRVTRLYLRYHLTGLAPAQKAELDGAHPRDLRAAPLLALVNIAGFGALAWLLVNQWVPATAVMGGWVVFGLAHASVSQASFWEGLVIAVLLLSQVAWPLAVYLKERRSRRTAS
jgi:hypothetical protein